MSDQTQPNNLAIKPTDKAATLNNLLAKVTPKMELVAPKGFDVQRLSSIMTDLLMATPDLLACAETPAGKNSFATAVMHIASLGLDASRVRKQVYVVPFKTSKKDKGGNWLSYTSAVLILDARGMIELIRRSGQFEGIIAKPVYKTDRFRFIEAPEPMIEHEPDLDREPFASFWPPIVDDPSGAKDKYGKAIKVYDWSNTNCEAAQLRGFYCMIKVKGETPLIGWMSQDAMLKRKAQSRSASSGPWVDWYVEMAIKTIVKATARHAPLSSEVMRAFALDDEIETGERPALPQRSADGKAVDLSDVIEYEESTGEDGNGAPIHAPSTKTDVVKGKLVSKAAQTAAVSEPGNGAAKHGQANWPKDPGGPDVYDDEEKDDATAPVASQERAAETKPAPVEQETPKPAPTPQAASVAAQAPLPDPALRKAREIAMTCSDYGVGKLYTERLTALVPPSIPALIQVLNVLRQNYGEDLRDGLALAWEGGALKSWATFKSFVENGVVQESVAQEAQPALEAETVEEYDPHAEEAVVADEPEGEIDPQEAYAQLVTEFKLTQAAKDFMLEHEPDPLQAGSYFTYIRDKLGRSIGGQIGLHLANKRNWVEAMAADGFEWNEGAQ